MRQVLLLLCVLLASPSALAQKAGLFYGVMLGSHNYEETGFTFEMPSVTGRGGYNMGSIFSVEGRLALGNSASSNGASMKMNWLTSALAKATWEVMDKLYVTGLAGFTAADTTVNAGGTTSSSTGSGVSYGMSIDLYADQNHGLNFEWMQYVDDTQLGTDYVIEYVGVGYFTRF